MLSAIEQNVQQYNISIHVHVFHFWLCIWFSVYDFKSKQTKFVVASHLFQEIKMPHYVTNPYNLNMVLPSQLNYRYSGGVLKTIFSLRFDGKLASNVNVCNRVFFVGLYYMMHFYSFHTLHAG